MTDDFGSWFQQARAKRGLTLADVSRATKIKESTLGDLEAARWGALPADVFVVGFVRAYARQVGLDGAEAVARYRRLRGSVIAEPVPAKVVAPAPPVDDPAESGGLLDGRMGVVLVVFLILIVATLTLSLLLGHGGPSSPVS